MAEIDLEALDISDKVLTIIFINLIFIANAGLIFKIVWRNLFKFTLIYDTKTLTIVSLAIGDVLLALFALVIRVRGLFDDEYRYENTHCRNTLSQVYSDLLIQYVYGMGLVVLAVELIFRLRQLNSQSTTGCLNIIMAYIVSAIPWGLGLVIVLPLSLVGMDWDYCYNDSMDDPRLRAMYIVSLCVPASLALFAGILVMCVPQSNNPPSEAPPVSQIQLQSPSTNGSNDSSTEHTTTPPVPAKASYPDDTSTKHMPTPPVAAQASYPGSPPPYLGYAHSQPPNYPQQYTSCNVYIPQPPSNEPPASVNFNKEKRTILLICIVYYICVIPYAGFVIGYGFNEDAPRLDDVVVAVLDRLFYWLLFCRSVVAPLIWTCRL